MFANKRVLFTNDQGGLSVVIPAPGVSEEEVLKTIPKGTAFEIVDIEAVPSDRTFRNAWEHCAENKVKVNVDSAKEITHERRRTKRAEDFAPFDEIIAKQIPGKSATEAEASRQEIRNTNAEIQIAIDAANSAEELKAIIETHSI